MTANKNSRVVSVRLNDKLSNRIEKLANRYNISDSMVIRDLLSSTHDLPHLVTRKDAANFMVKSKLLNELNSNYESLKYLLLKSRKLVGSIPPSSLYGSDNNNIENENITRLNWLTAKAVQLIRKSIEEVS